ncbi:MAG: dienelactone hydrolase family protein [Bdellovibrionales bacterium]|nr:dienelactone hydrolase family protein [Bdellovibrionales bacterium]
MKDISIEFIEYKVPDLLNPGQYLTIKGKLKLPKKNCKKRDCRNKKFPAVVILHGSAGIDFRGEFYAQALNQSDVATLEIDMWAPRGGARPQLPILTFPDAFGALAYLTFHVPSIDSQKIGVLGFSWGGVMSLAFADIAYTNQFGQGLKFAAHVANYPVCYAFNNTTVPSLPSPFDRGTQLLHLTGSPVLIQVGSEDDYDNGVENCVSLKQTLSGSDQQLVRVKGYEGAYHAWDRLLPEEIIFDPFANEGSYFSTGEIPPVVIEPNVKQAYESRRRVTRFFVEHLK